LPRASRRSRGAGRRALRQILVNVLSGVARAAYGGACCSSPKRGELIELAFSVSRADAGGAQNPRRSAWRAPSDTDVAVEVDGPDRWRR
jgi:hypothetical protein